MNPVRGSQNPQRIREEKSHEVSYEMTYEVPYEVPYELTHEVNHEMHDGVIHESSHNSCLTAAPDSQHRGNQKNE